MRTKTSRRWSVRSLVIGKLFGLLFVPALSAATTNVVFKDFSFSPQTVTIQVGDSVTWTNAGGTHTVTGDGTDPFCGSAPVPQSCSTTFTEAGTFPYHCNFHASFGMVGTVIVTASSTGGGGGGTGGGSGSLTNKIDDPIPAKIAKGSITIELRSVAEGLAAPLGIASPDDQSGRVFVYDQTGLVQLLEQGSSAPAPYLDVRDRLVPLMPSYDERGLLGVAFHPNFAQHPFLYTHTSEPNGSAADFAIAMPAGQTNDHQDVIAEWRVDPANTNRIDPNSHRELFRIDKPQSNHNGGTIRFGPDGFLYLAFGDGGAADDQGPGHSPGGNGQDRSKILGKVVRIDVDGRTSKNGQYGIPTDNPFVSDPGSLPEIYAFGLRNPYSFSFDSGTGDLLLGDVGQNDVEEVDRVVKGGNFGWSIKEGSFFFDANGTNNGFVSSVPVRDVPSDLVDPIAEYDHDEGDAVIGGFLYRGTAVPALAGKYVFGDLGRADEGKMGRLFYLDGTQVTELVVGTNDRPLGVFLKGFGEDRSGELYVLGSTNLGPSGTGGKVLRIVNASTSTNGSTTNSFIVRNLISDQPGTADVTDPNLVNPWGLTFNSTGPFWISDNHSGLSTVYNSTGGVQTLTVKIPSPPGSTNQAAPTGIVFNGGTNFALPTGPARFIFAAEDGTIAAWNGGSNAVLKVDNSAAGAIYKGLALAKTGGSNLLFAANFHAGSVDVFDQDFTPIVRPGAFVDATMPTNFASFNVEVINGELYVAFAKQDENKEDDVPGAGNGFIDTFDLTGKMLSRLVSGEKLNSPWALTVAPPGFGPFSGALLVGNFGDGAINAFDPGTGSFLGTLLNGTGDPIHIDGLWALKFGNGGQAGDPGVLYFTSGPGNEDHGLFGSISPAAYLHILHAARTDTKVLLTWAGGAAPYQVQQKGTLNDTNWTTLVTTTNLSATISPAASGVGFFRISAQGGSSNR